MLYNWSTPEKYLTNGKVNKGYIWLCLRNSFLLYQREKKKAIKVDLEAIQELSANETNIDFFQSYFPCTLIELKDSLHFIEKSNANTILFSPIGQSLDEFKNYVERGLFFKNLFH